jgi:hypothetical protein
MTCRLLLANCSVLTLKKSMMHDQIRSEFSFDSSRECVRGANKALFDDTDSTS